MTHLYATPSQDNRKRDFKTLFITFETFMTKKDVEEVFKVAGDDAVFELGR